jgi:excisionase family DNA binding protein
MPQRGSAEFRFFTIKQIAAQLGVSERTVSRWIASRELKSHKFGAAVRISEDDFRAFVAVQRQGVHCGRK